jgi:predicted MFS family arabinose efflux permease
MDGPVRQAFVVELVGREQLVNAVALNSSIFNVARIIGPAVAGAAIALVGFSAAFFMNAASYVAVLAAYAAMHPAEFRAGAPQRATGNVLRQIGEGIRYSWNTPAVLFIFILLAAIGTFGYNFTVVVPLVAKFVLDVGEVKFSILTSAMGVGSLVAALALAAMGHATQRTLLIATASFIVIFAAIAASSMFWLTAALFVALGVASIFFSTTINTTIQLIVPDELRGRVMSIFFLLFAGSTPIGGWLTGVLGDAIGVRQTLFIEAGICALGLATAMVYRSMHSAAFHEAPPVRGTRPAGGTAAGGS